MQNSYTPWQFDTGSETYQQFFKAIAPQSKKLSASVGEAIVSPPALTRRKSAPVSRDDTPIITAPSHTQRAFDVRIMPRIVDWVAGQMKEFDIDAIVACGHSGLVVAGAVSYKTGMPTFAVRKKGEPTVAGFNAVSAVAGHGRAKRWAWLDDCFSTGGTFAHAADVVVVERLVQRHDPAVAILYAQEYGDEIIDASSYRGKRMGLESSLTVRLFQP